MKTLLAMSSKMVWSETGRDWSVDIDGLGQGRLNKGRIMNKIGTLRLMGIIFKLQKQ
ncbi:MAG: hypothetical protein IV104_05325 [Acidovorax sp.]|nr:hypothetical protein [Acidovorax sp.]